MKGDAKDGISLIIILSSFKSIMRNKKMRNMDTRIHHDWEPALKMKNKTKLKKKILQNAILIFRIQLFSERSDLLYMGCFYSSTDKNTLLGCTSTNYRIYTDVKACETESERVSSSSNPNDRIEWPRLVLPWRPAPWICDRGNERVELETDEQKKRKKKAK